MATEEDALTRETSSNVRQTTCCIVGGGPAEAMLGLLLAHKGISVMLLEAHKDFDREYRADTLHPYILEILDKLDLADALHRMRHSRIRQWNQQMIQRRIKKNEGRAGQPSQVPLMGRLIRQMPFVRKLPAYLTAYGLFPPQIKMECSG